MMKCWKTTISSDDSIRLEKAIGKKKMGDEQPKEKEEIINSEGNKVEQPKKFKQIWRKKSI